MSNKQKLNIYSLNKRLTELENKATNGSNESDKINELIERIDVLEKIIFSVHAQPQKEEKKPSHPEVWDPSVKPRPKDWGRGYSPPIQKTPDGTKAHPGKGG